MYTNISIYGRVIRIALSIGLVMAVMNMSAPLGAMVYLPFISIYAGITGFIGWDPVNAVVKQFQEQAMSKPGYVHHDRLITH